MSFEQRIMNTLPDGTPSACPYIQLEKEELQYYHGCGLCIAAEQHGFVYDLLYIVNDIVDANVPDERLAACVSNIVSKIPLNNGENVKFWLCMASSTQLCEPYQIADYNLDLVIQKICIETVKWREEINKILEEE